MRRLPGGEFMMGSDRFYPEERPARRVRVDAFWIDATPVTNREFTAFVDATGYQTFAEIAPDPAEYSGMSADMARAGSLVFESPRSALVGNDPGQWWRYRFGACWRHPLGEGSSILGLEDHPVVHVAYCDAEAYASWADKALPTEAEWEYAARGGLDGAEFSWGDDELTDGRIPANVWQGDFPYRTNEMTVGWERTSAVRSFPANGYGLYDMIGNVWEWTADWFDPAFPALRVGRKVLKGGSHLCAPNYCLRYRPAARIPLPVDTTAGHVGFRCMAR